MKLAHFLRGELVGAFACDQHRATIGRRNRGAEGGGRGPADRAPFEKLAAYKKRVGWNIKWVSSAGDDFNRDYHVSHTPDELEKKEGFYNYIWQKPYASEAPGISVFYKDTNGAISASSSHP
jgi:hypothetical protein